MVQFSLEMLSIPEWEQMRGCLEAEVLGRGGGVQL